MSYFHLSRSRTRTRSPSPPPVPKRSRIITLSDSEDGKDDYPYSTTHRPSRALSLRATQPSTLERYNIWSDKRASLDLATTSQDKEWDHERDLEIERVKTIRRDDGHHRHHHHHHHHDKHHSHHDDILATDPDEASFRLKIQARFPRPHHHHHHVHVPHHHHHVDVLTRKDVDEASEHHHHHKWRSGSRERRHRHRRDSFFDEDSVGDYDEAWWEGDSWSRYRRVKRTKTEEWRPLIGWRRG